MIGTAWLAPLADTGPARRLADAALIRLAHKRTRDLDRLDLVRAQENTLLRLVRKARDTQFGRAHHFDRIESVAEFQARVPIREYEYFWQTYWKDPYPRIEGKTWPGFVPYYALSSGTTSGTTKYIPITREMVRSNQKAAFTTLALFRHVRPRDELFTGKFFFLGGSTDLRRQDDGSLAGDLSGIAARENLDLLRPYQFPPDDITTIADWEVKVQKLAEQGVKERITAISGVPAWVLVLFDRMKKVTGKQTVAEIWPDLRLVVHGGTNFAPYRDLFTKEIGSDRVSFIETYPASEGFVATEDPRYGMLRLLPDHNIFFEFVPADELGSDKAPRHTLREVEPGVRYAVVLSTCAGLWAYLVGDTVTFERTNPPLLRFSGRTKHFLSAFGEHLIAEEIENAVAHAARVCGTDVVDFHVGPVFPTDPRTPGHHVYLVEFVGTTPDVSRFSKALDDELIRLNEDYAAHRVGDLSMLSPRVRPVAKGSFADWMKSRGKYGGQNKVPRMDNTGVLTKELEGWFGEKDGFGFQNFNLGSLGYLS
ncbi:MAG TPA: GH3 auxin-responsive promoter family protein [Fimbriiglobus sp.]